MMPGDDPTWMVCVDHNAQHWCRNMALYYSKSHDASQISPGLRYCVPVVPDLDVYAQVTITNDYGGGMGGLELVRPDPTDPFGAEEYISLGMWCKGEGRMVMMYSIMQWVEASSQDVCRHRGHGLTEENMLNHLEPKYETAFSVELLKIAPDLVIRRQAWSLAYHGMCWPCHKRVSQSSSAPPSFDPADYGVDASATNAGQPRTSSQARAAEALARFRNNQPVLPD